MARLIIVSGPATGRDHRLEGGRISIGRDPANTIVINDTLISKRHAEVIRGEDGSLRIVDVGSSNGTLVNDRQVVEHLLVQDDRIQLGESVLRFEAEEADTAVDEGAKTVLIEDDATRLSLPAEAVSAARASVPPPSGDGGVSEGTIYISDDEAGAPATPTPDPDPGPATVRKQTRLPVMPILLGFIAVMIIIGCILTWMVVQRSRGPESAAVTAAEPIEQLAAEPAPTIGHPAADEPVTVVAESDLIAEPLAESTVPAETGPAAGTPPAGATVAPVTTRTPEPVTVPPPIVTRPPPRTDSIRTTAPPPTRTVTPPPATTTAQPPPSRPVEVTPPPARPARPAIVAPDATHGVLHVLTKPEGATIYINEERMGTTNTKKKMSAGKYIIRLEYQGQSVTDDVKVKVQQVSTFFHDFTPPPARSSRKDDDDDDDDDDDEDDEDDEDKDKDDDDDDDEDDDEDDDDDEDEDEEDGKKKKKLKDRLKDIFG